MPALAPCRSCGTPVDAIQRYCLACGAPCSDEAARLLALAGGRAAASSSPGAAGPPPPDAVPAPSAGSEADGPGGGARTPWRDDRRAIMSTALAALGVGILMLTGWGSNTAQTLASALPPGLSVRYPAATPVAGTPAAPPAAGDTDGSAAGADAVDPTPAPDDTASTDSSTGTTTTDASAPTTTAPNDPTTTPTTDTPDAPVPPPIKHVYLVVLSGQDVAAAAQTPDAAPYLAKLAARGTVLTGYRGIAAGSLPNAIALVSGQGPTPETAAGCPVYTDIAPGTIGDGGQQLGQGCVSSAQSGTIGDQLASTDRTWRGYIEGPAGAGCRHPAAGAADDHQAALPGDAAVTWRNPFAYFHTTMDAPDCAALLPGLDALDADLAAGAKAPALSYIVPDRCHDGSPDPCSDGAPAGLAAADTWLSTIVPKILASTAYADGGLLAITSDATEVNGADDPACCRPKSYPNLPDAGQGGRVGALLVSPYVAKGKLVDTSYSHFTLLRTIEDIFTLDPLGYAAAKNVGSLVPTVIEPTKVG